MTPEKDLKLFDAIRKKWDIIGYLYVNKETQEIHLDGETEIWELPKEMLTEMAALKTEVLINNVTTKRGLRISDILKETPVKEILELRDKSVSGNPEKLFLTHLLRVCYHPEIIRRIKSEKIPRTAEDAHEIWNAPKHPIRNGVLLAVNELLEPDNEF